MNNLFVYCEIEEGNVADVSLELLTKGRSLANQLNCQLEAVVAGSGLKDFWVFHNLFGNCPSIMCYSGYHSCQS